MGIKEMIKKDKAMMAKLSKEFKKTTGSLHILTNEGRRHVLDLWRFRPFEDQILTKEGLCIWNKMLTIPYEDIKEIYWEKDDGEV